MKTKRSGEISLLTLAEVASILKISKRTLLRIMENDAFPAFKVGGQWRVQEKLLCEWITKQQARE